MATVSGMAEKARAVTVGEARSQPSVTQTLLSQNQQPELILQREDALEPGDSVVDGTVYDEFTFEGRAGQAIAVTVRSDEWVGEIIVIDPQGNPVLRPTVECPENLYCADEDPLSSDSLSAVTLTLPQNGTYRLRVQDGEGPYRLAVWDGADAYQMLEQANELLPQAIGVNIDVGTGQTSFEEPDAAVLTQLQSLVSEAYQIFQAAGDEAGQELILTRYPQFATASEGDDSTFELVGQILGSMHGTEPGGPDIEGLGLNYGELVEAGEEELTLARENGGAGLESRALVGLIQNYIGRGQYQQALDALEQYREVELAKASDPDDIAAIEDYTLPELAWIHHLLGQYEKSNAIYKRYFELSIAQQNDQPVDRLSEIPNNSGGTEDLPFFLESASQIFVISYLPYVAYNYYAMGEYQGALDLTERIQQQSERYRDEVWLPLLEDREYADELPPQYQAVQDNALASFEGGGSMNLAVRAHALNALGRHSEAIDTALQVLEKEGTWSASSAGPNALIPLGQAYYALGDLAKAGETYQQLLIVASKLGDRWSEAYAYSRLAELLVDKKQPELAIAFYKKSVNTREAIRSDNQALPRELKLSFVETIAEDYRALADLLLQQDRIFEAQEVLDLLRVQELEDFLHTVRGNEQLDGTLDYWPSEQSILEIYAQELQQGAETPLDAFISRADVQTEVQQLKRTASSQNLNPDSLENLQDNLRALDRAALLYPLVLEDRLEIILVSENDIIRETVPVNRQTLNAEILQFRRDITNINSNPAGSGQQLYTRLIQPLEDKLAAADIQTLLYAADSQLRYIPLSALHDGEQWLVQRYNINQITAASLTDFSAPDSQNLSVIAGAFSEGQYSFEVGDSQFSFSGLPFAGKEVDLIGQEIANSETFFNQQFNPSNVLPNLASYGIVHFATHAAFLPGSPDNSFILFGNGDRINLRDISSWELPNVDLVVLSACETAVSGGLGNGDEILGFGYQIQRTGARAAIASLWQVDDGGTQTLMNSFYLALQNGYSKTEALQRSQLALINDDLSFVGEPRAGIQILDADTGEPIALEGSSEHPYYWAPFILIGNGL
ncbi:CHAT domain-containing protein [Romeria aff. gracilis LEGE 07310]|uniref:CHAT domain-containing protein n=1 Tax=Vasconcelosia minhoensis LEGE 07310 TaxID=915328 RepID=A0A8J7DF35_9CYAN|nr:CHAT domain-containing protein [Romeria aff. gracilis LEGE 07310]